jgi:hypothetical protein
MELRHTAEFSGSHQKSVRTFLRSFFRRPLWPRQSSRPMAFSSAKPSSAASNNGTGSVYSLDVGLAPFVNLASFTGKLGNTVTILGTHLKGATPSRSTASRQTSKFSPIPI